ncbi:hypothetical protein [Microbulbifer sp. JMSA002]|uniref:hypothetical protein n=1 Tax=Microbulbifer sp. JMSA002 TaxID=3243368 RepID=UPI004039ED81
MDITYKLPHPVRISCNEIYEREIHQQDDFYDTVLSGVKIENSCLDYIGAIFDKKCPSLIDHYMTQGLTKHEAMIAISSTALPYKYRKTEGTILTTSKELDLLLENTDIGDDIPIAYLRPPFQNCYIEFTENRSSSLFVFNSETGEHILEGVYISETEILPGTVEMEAFKNKAEVDASKALRILDLMFTGSPVGKQNNKDDALRLQSFYIQDDNRTILEELESIECMYGGDADFVGDIPYLAKTLYHMAKVLLFINCKQYRDTAFNERKEIEKKLSSLKSFSKINKYKNKLRKSYNRLVIKPEDNVKYLKGDSNEHPSGVKSKKAHWRKGHFRMQPYGVGASKRKIVFIEPTVVGGIYAGKKIYTAKTKPNESGS